MFQEKDSWLHRYQLQIVFVAGIWLLVVGFFVGSFVNQLRNDSKVFEFEDGRVLSMGEIDDFSEDVDFQMYQDIWNSIQSDYVFGPVPEKDLFYASLEGLVSGLGDPYSVFFDPESAKKFHTDLEGEFQGIGAEIGIRDKQLQIIAPLPDSPAINSGIMAGDKIFMIDDVETAGMSVEEAVGMIRGERGTEVVLAVAHEGSDEILDVGIVRDVIEISSVKWEIRDDGIAIVNIYAFNDDTSAQFNKAVGDIVNAGASGIIIDLRNNPGGYLDAAVSVAGEWIGANVVVNERSDGGFITPVSSQSTARLSGLPSVVLVNGGSASASEIVAGALQDYEEAVIVGTQTFGKGSVQKFMDLPGGSALKITVAEWLTPQGRSIQTDGITPDDIVEFTDKDIEEHRDVQFERAVETIESLKNK